jgi:hypothetical protein
MESSSEQQVAIKSCSKAGKTATETVEVVRAAYTDEALTLSNIFGWYGRFREGQEDVQDDTRSGGPSGSRTDSKIENVWQLLLQCRQLSLRMTADEPDISYDAVRQTVVEDLNKRNWFLLHDNAPSHNATIVKQFLAKKIFTVVYHPSYSPDLAPADEFLFPKVKFNLKGRRFDTISDIQNKVTSELKEYSGI